MRSTRRGFGRRALSFGLAIFCAITLMSVGFAAWVLSNNANLDSSGGITTETITDKSVNIVITNADKNKVLYDSVDENGVGTGKKQNLVFGHLPVDNPDANKGFIQTDGEDGKADNEDLQFVVKGTVDNVDKIGQLHFQVRVPDSLIAAAGLSKYADTWSYDPAKAFIRLPSFARTSDGKQIPYITGTLTAPDGDGKVKYEFPAKTDNWTGAMTEDVLWTDPSALLTSGSGTAVITDLDGNQYTIKYVSGRTDKLEFELTINFQWGARYLGMNPNYFYDVNERVAGKHDQLTTDAPNPYNTTNMDLVNYDLLLVQTIINGLNLEDYLTANNVDATEIYKDTGIVLGGATLEDYIKSNPDGIKAKLGVLQENIATAIANLGKDADHKKAPLYAFWIYADVK